MKNATKEKSNDPALLAVEQLKKYFPLRRGLLRRTVAQVKAVDGVSFTLNAGETLGLVGESGCGKTTLGRMVVRLEEPTAGAIRWKGEDLLTRTGRSLKSVRRQLQIIFQDPYGSLNPRMSVQSILEEPFRIHRTVTKKKRLERVSSLLDKVGLSARLRHRYPHEFSGGQRQRLGIARAIALSPDLVVCDEPVSALDVSVQAQIINLLMRLQEADGLAYLFIAHDLAVVKHVSHRVAVMYLGRIVELAASGALFREPLHPYTQALLAAVPVPDPATKRPKLQLGGEVPSPLHPPAGCHFSPRCPRAAAQCRETYPPLTEVAAGHWVACYETDHRR